jgi:hypothetical protein
MVDGIKEKLSLELSKPISEESQVVYVLSRIRKILEIDQSSNGGKYSKLKFYCDWALHTKIDKNRAFQEEFVKFIKGDMSAGAPILTFEVFQTEFLDFLAQYGISSEVYKIPENNISFRKLLAKIYADTPIIVTLIKTFEIKTNEGIFTKSKEMFKYNIGFKITPLD